MEVNNNLDSSIQKFYSNLKTPIFLCNVREILWHNKSADKLNKNHHFRQYVLQLEKPKSETTKIFICDERYYRILIRPYEKSFFLEIIENWSLNSTLDTSISLKAPQVLDSVVRNSAHQIFQSVVPLSKILENNNELDNLIHVDRIANATYRMLRATNLYYEYNLLLQGKMNLEIVDIFGEIDALCSTVNSLMNKSEINFSWSVPNEKIFCDIDIHKFSFALFHLICNSYTFNSSKNDIKVTVQSCPNNSIKLDISDKGGGINPAILTKVFNPYFSYDKLTGDVAGCGLGLTYASVFVKKSGGTLTLSSENGETVASIMLPINPVANSEGLSSHVVDYEVGKYDYMVSTMSKTMIDF